MRKPVYKVINENRKSAVIKENSKFCIEYKKGKKVNKIKDTIGIFTFRRKWQAERFIGNSIRRLKCEIIRVTPIGRGGRPKVICFDPTNTNLRAFYKNKSNYTDKWIPNGTVCYDAVIPLE